MEIHGVTYFKFQNQIKFQSRLLDGRKVHFRINTEIKTVRINHKIKEFMSNKPALQKSTEK